MSKKQKTVLFEYTNYREFLRDWFQEQKETVSKFSYRYFAKKAGFVSANFFKLVVDGKRNLTHESLPKMIKGLTLNKQEEEFFTNLVYFNQAKNDAEKNLFFNKILKSKKIKALKPIIKDQYLLYSQLHHVLIRELLLSEEFNGNYNWIKEKLLLKVSKEEVEESVELLQRIGLIEKSKDGKFKQCNTVISTGNESDSFILLQYHKKLLEVSSRVIDFLPQEERDISSLTLGVAKSKVSKIKNMIQEFRKQVLEFVSDDEHPEEVVMLNMQFFPMTKTIKGKHEK